MQSTDKRIEYFVSICYIVVCALAWVLIMIIPRGCTFHKVCAEALFLHCFTFSSSPFFIQVQYFYILVFTLLVLLQLRSPIKVLGTRIKEIYESHWHIIYGQVKLRGTSYLIIDHMLHSLNRPTIKNSGYSCSCAGFQMV